MKKTGQEWLNETPLFVRKAWEKNVKNNVGDKSYHNRKQFLLQMVTDRFQFFSQSFVFCETCDGHDFWASIARGEKPSFLKFVSARFKKLIS